MKANVEYTDTYGGDANYSWVDRHSFNADGMSDLAIVRKAKKLVGLSGLRGKSGWIGGVYTFTPNGFCTVMFITFSENHE
tara:strand:- start:14575 stop:14814 length:240 start_codon:yes stop_codon:yes gene_type:complete